MSSPSDLRVPEGPLKDRTVVLIGGGSGIGLRVWPTRPSPPERRSSWVGVRRTASPRPRRSWAAPPGGRPSM
ncbi:hypothetical protein [Streptomyces sp. NPDC024089]|uniref:hypothetical protein n=1 Tax=Streptomyces sp. NPDC024089 TaxID=3154328 RepID=UPI003402F3A5